MSPKIKISLFIISALSVIGRVLAPFIVLGHYAVLARPDLYSLIPFHP